MNQRQAELLAAGDREYRARKLHGRWVVWCDASDHVVEFDEGTIAAIIQADYDLSNTGE